MAYTTVEIIKARARAKLDDIVASPNELFPAAATAEAFQSAWNTFDLLRLYYQVPKVKVVALATITAGAVQHDPGAGFGELVKFEERLNGSTDLYSEVYAVEWLPQVSSRTVIGEYVWREDKFLFVPPTTDRQIRLTYFATAAPPSNGEIAIDGIEEPMALLTAAELAPLKGEFERGKQLKVQAIGSQFEESGRLGGMFYQFFLPQIRALQKSPVAPRPFRVGVTPRVMRRTVFIGPAEVQSAMVDLNITGAIDGANATFTLSDNPSPISSLLLMRNGNVQAENVAFTISGVTITFLPGYIPQTGDLLKAKAQV